MEGSHQRIAQELAWAARELEEAGVETPRLDAEVLLSHVIRLTRTQIIARPQVELAVQDSRRFHELINKRRTRYPLAYLTGVKEFWGLEFEVNPSVLIPRPETEILVEACWGWLDGRRAVIAEIGVGSGAVAVALAKELPMATIYGTEISEEAAAVAVRNVKRHSVGRRVKIVVGDLTQPLFEEGLGGRVDALVSNPPYVASSVVDKLQPEVLFEPRDAIVAGEDRLCFYRRILADAPELLAPGGRVFLEIDSGMAATIEEMAPGYGLELVETLYDLALLERDVVLECVS